MAGIEIQGPSQRRGREAAPLRELVQDTDLSQAVLAAQVLLVQEPETTRVRAVEATDRRHRLIGRSHRCI